MGKFDEKRVAYLRNRAQMSLDSEKTLESDIDRFDVEKELEACKQLREDISEEIDGLNASMSMNIGTLRQEMADIEQLIQFKKVDMERSEYEKPIPEDPKQLIAMMNSEDEAVKKEYANMKIKIDINLKLVNQYDPETGNLLDRYIENSAKYKEAIDEVKKEMEDNILPESYEQLQLIINSELEAPERKEKIISNLKTLSNINDFQEQLDRLSQNIIAEKDAAKESEINLNVVKNEREKLLEEINIVKNGGYPNDKHKELLDKPEIKKYIEEEIAIARKEDLIKKEEQIDSLQLPDTFTALGKMKPEDRKATEQKINALLEREAPFARDGAAVKSIQDYYDGLKKLDELENIVKKKITLIPDDDKTLGAFMTLPTITNQYPGLLDASNKVVNAENALVAAQEALYEEKIRCEKLPETMTELKKLSVSNPKKYKYVKENVDKLIETLSITGVKTLDDYFVIAQRAEEEKAQTMEKAVKVKQVNIVNALAALKSAKNEELDAAGIKKLIKEKIKTSNKIKKPDAELKKRELEVNTAKSELENERKKAKSLIANFNKQIEANNKAEVENTKKEQDVLKNQLTVMKAYIKKTIKAEKESLQNVIDNDNIDLETLIKNHEASKDAFNKETKKYYDNCLKLCDQKIEANQIRIKTANDNISKMEKEFNAIDEQVFTASKENNKSFKKSEKFNKLEEAGKSLQKAHQDLEDDEKLLRGYFESYNSKQQSALKQNHIDIEKSFGQAHNDYVNSTILNNLQNRQKKAKRSYYLSYIISKGMGIGSDVVSSASDKLQELVLILGEAQIKGEIKTLQDEINSLTEQRNRYRMISAEGSAGMYHQMSSENITPEQAREIVNMKNEQDSYKAEIQELSQKIINLEKKKSELNESTQKRIREFREKILGPKKDEVIVNRDVQVKKAKLRSDLVNELAPDDQVSNSIATEKEKIAIDEQLAFEVLGEEEKLAYDDQQKFINEAADKLEILFTENNMSKIDIAIDATIMIAGLVKKIINKGDSNESEKDSAEDSSEISRESIINSFDELVNKLPDFKDEDKQKDPHFVEEIMNILPELVNKVNNISSYLMKEAALKKKECGVNERLLNILVAENDDFTTYLAEQNEVFGNAQEQKKDSPEQEMDKLEQEMDKPKQNNLLEHQRDKLNRKIKDIEEGTKREIDLCTKIADRLESKQEQIEEKLGDKENEKTSLEEKESSNAESLLAERKELIHEFSTILVQEEKEEHIKPVLSVDDIMNDPAEGKGGLQFLAKLTGKVFDEKMLILDAMRNLESVYINGINAVTYFGLEEKFKQAIVEDIKLESEYATEWQSDFTKDLMQQINTCGLDLKNGLRYVVTKDEQQKSSLSHNPLAGQLIAVEDEHMFLNAVQITSPEIERYQLNLKAPVKPEGSNKKELQDYENAKQTYEANLQIYKDNKAIMSYSKSNASMYNEFNEMRREVADYELGINKTKDIESGSKEVKHKEKHKDESKKAITTAILGGKGL